MVVFAIRHAPTQRYLPAGKDGRILRKGFSWTEPLKDGGHFGPRLFGNYKSAQNALSAWLQGRWVQETTRSGEYGMEIDVETYPREPEVPRKREEMEIVPFKLVEVK